MRTIDLHCDALMKHYLASQVAGGFREPAEVGEPDFVHGRTMVTLDGMRAGHALAQVFAIFMVPAEVYRGRFGVEPLSDEAYFEGCLALFRQMLVRHADVVAQARCATDIEQNDARGLMSAMLSVEDGRIVAGSLDRLRQLFELGVCAIGLTWNAPNCFGAPNSRDAEVMGRGLTPFGHEAVELMQELGILVDVSHLSDGGFWDVVKICERPFVATHSNCRALASHPRNLTDEMIRALGEAGGVAGLNFCPGFLTEDPENRRSSAAQIARHARHMADVGGIGCVAIGSDFDGIEGDLEVSGPGELGLLEGALRVEGFDDADIDKISHGNALRVMRDAIGS